MLSYIFCRWDSSDFMSAMPHLLLIERIWNVEALGCKSPPSKQKRPTLTALTNLPTLPKPINLHTPPLSKKTEILHLCAVSRSFLSSIEVRHLLWVTSTSIRGSALHPLLVTRLPLPLHPRE